MPRFDKIAFVASETKEAQEALQTLTKRYGDAPAAKADVIVALGGDGLMLQTMHRHLNSRIPIYGMNRGSVGFLLNDYDENKLMERLEAAETTVIHPLRMTAHDRHGATHEALAINEVSLFRQIYQAAKLRIAVDGKVRMDELDLRRRAGFDARRQHRLQSFGAWSDPADQCAASGGDADQPVPPAALARRPSAQRRQGRHRGARAREAPGERGGRPYRVSRCGRVEVVEESGIDIFMMFDPGHTLAERILSEQFGY